MELNNVSSWYDSILGREADTAGLDYWQGLINSGMDVGDVRSAFFNAAADELQGDDSALDPVTDAWDERRLVDSMNLYYQPQELDFGMQTTPLSTLHNQSFYDYQSGFPDFSRPASDRLGGFDITQHTADAYVAPMFGQQAATDYIAQNAPAGNAPSYINALRSNRSNVSAVPYSYQRTNVGAADGQIMGAGSGPYASQLIQALRQSSAQPFSTNRGIDLTSITGGPNQTNVSNMQPAPSASNLAFSPQRLNNTPMQIGGAVATSPNSQNLAPIGMGTVFGEGNGGGVAPANSGSMTAGQAMNAVALGSGLSNYGSTLIAPGAFAAGLLGNAMMNTGQNALSSLDAAMLGISPGAVDAGGMTAGNSADIGPGYSF